MNRLTFDFRPFRSGLFFPGLCDCSFPLVRGDNDIPRAKDQQMLSATTTSTKLTIAIWMPGRRPHETTVKASNTLPTASPTGLRALSAFFGDVFFGEGFFGLGFLATFFVTLSAFTFAFVGEEAGFLTVFFGLLSAAFFGAGLGLGFAAAAGLAAAFLTGGFFAAAAFFLTGAFFAAGFFFVTPADLVRGPAPFLSGDGAAGLGAAALAFS